MSMKLQKVRAIANVRVEAKTTIGLASIEAHRFAASVVRAGDYRDVFMALVPFTIPKGTTFFVPEAERGRLKGELEDNGEVDRITYSEEKHSGMAAEKARREAEAVKAAEAEAEAELAKRALVNRRMGVRPRKLSIS